MPYNPENHGIAPHHARGAAGAASLIWGACPGFLATQVRRKRLHSPSGSKDLVKRPAAVGKMAPVRAGLP